MALATQNLSPTMPQVAGAPVPSRITTPAPAPTPASSVELEAVLCRRSLSRFVRHYWPQMDPDEYRHGWHIDVICAHLEAVTAGQIRRLIINIPPRHTKSLLAAVAWPAWAWTRRPSLRFLSASYAADLSVRDSVRCRRLVESPQYQEAYGGTVTLRGDQNQKARFETSAGGYRLATSVGGATTGEGGDVLIIDDPHSVDQAQSDVERQAALDWFDGTMLSRLNDRAAGGIVVIMQRVHERDLTGHLLAAGGWEHLCLPAEYEPPRRCVTVLGVADRRTVAGEILAPERFDRATLAEMRALPYWWSGQYQQDPTPAVGGMFPRGCFGEPLAASPDDIVLRVRSWDFAATEQRRGADPDYTAGVLAGIRRDGRVVVLDVDRSRVGPADRDLRVRGVAERDGHGVPVQIETEGGSAGKSVTDHYQRVVLAGYEIHGNRPTGAKTERMGPLSALAQAGHVSLLAGAWNSEFVAEAERVPKGAHDDQVDAAAAGYQFLSERFAGRVISGAPTEAPASVPDWASRVLAVWFSRMGPSFAGVGARWIDRDADNRERDRYAVEAVRELPGLAREAEAVLAEMQGERRLASMVLASDTDMDTRVAAHAFLQANGERRFARAAPVEHGIAEARRLLASGAMSVCQHDAALGLGRVSRDAVGGRVDWTERDAGMARVVFDLAGWRERVEAGRDPEEGRRPFGPSVVELTMRPREEPPEWA